MLIAPSEQTLNTYTIYKHNQKPDNYDFWYAYVNVLTCSSLKLIRDRKLPHCRPCIVIF